MKGAFRLIFVIFIILMLVSRSHRARFTVNNPTSPTQAQSARGDNDQSITKAPRGFNKRNWYGGDTTNVIDPTLTRRNFLIVLDGSGSMADVQCSGNLPKIKAAKQAIVAFSQKISPDDNLGLCAFDSRGVTERSPLSLNRAAFTKALLDVRSDSNTPLGTAVKLGYAKLQKQAQHQLGYGEYYLIIVTDGEADRGNDPRDIVNKIVSESPVVISTIGFCIGQGHSLNRPGLTMYHDATNLEELNQGLESVLAESDYSDAAGAK